MNSFVLRGNIIHSLSIDEIFAKPDAYLVVIDGKIAGIFDDLAYEYRDLEIIDCKDNIIIPGLVDLHIHAPQYEFKGLGMDLELLDWLNAYTFPIEAKYASTDYAREKYKIFVDALRKSPTTRAVIFATIHVDSTIILMDLLEESGLISFVGKVNMDRNCMDELREDTETSYEETLRWICEVEGRYKNTFPILTPRFIPSCSNELMEGLGNIRRKYNLPVQSHLSENKSEIKWVKELEPNAICYADAYSRFNMLGKYSKAVMAHCIWCGETESDMLKEEDVFIAHCPNSNFNLASGIAPVRKYISQGQKLGLGSDVAGGSYISIFRQITDAISASKMYYRLVDDKKLPLSYKEAFYLATAGGGEFFGDVGNFKTGSAADILVIDDKNYRSDDLNLLERLQRIIYYSRDEDILHKFVEGEKLF